MTNEKTTFKKININEGKDMWFTEPFVRRRIEQCLPTITISSKPLDEIRQAVTGSRYNKKKLGVTISTKTLYDMVGIDEYALSEHLSESGFHKVSDWVAAIKKQHRLEKKFDVRADERFYVVRVSPICKRRV